MTYWLIGAICYFLPPLAGIIFGPSMVIFNRVWLFNIVYILFWPILIWLIPSSDH